VKAPSSDSDRMKCVEAALQRVPEDYRAVGANDLLAQENGHGYHRGMHIGWAWGEDRRGVFLDFLSEHRMAGMQAERIYADGTAESIETPVSIHQVTGDPAKDAEIERKFFERNSASYADLRERGLLPAAGQNLVSQDVNEFLLSGGSTVDE